MVLSDVVDGPFKFTVEEEEIKFVYYVTPNNRGDLVRFKPGMRLLIEGDLERYSDAPSGVPDLIHIARAASPRPRTR